MKSNNPLWRLLASVQLAIFTFVALATTSIIGTIIPQHRALDFYQENYGDFWAQIFIVLDFDAMYGSWWFIAMLTVLAINIIVCSIDKFPTTQKKVRSLGGTFSPSKLAKMPFTHEQATTNPSFDPQEFLSKNGWKASKHESEEGTLFFAQKQAWSHYGVYLVHLSILVIFIGAIIGNIAGYKGSVMIPELGGADKIYSPFTSAPMDLPFEVRCDAFYIDYYDTGAPKTYLSTLTIIEDGQEVLTQDIEVNHPLIYNGITFYQASYEGFQTFIITLTDKETGEKHSFRADYQKQSRLEAKGVQVGILNAQATKQHVERVKLWFFDEKNEPQTLWLDNNVAKDVPNTPYNISVKQMYATGLQVAYDPGVWVVYLGCALMLIGLYICFFLSHRKVWILQTKSAMLLAATSNKNSIGFETTFTSLKSAFCEENKQ